MKLDKTLIIALVPPLIAIVLCMAYPYLVRENITFASEQPDFLTYVDKLSVFTLKNDLEPSQAEIRDVFRHEWTLPMAGLYALPDTKTAEPLKLSMIVEAGSRSFCVINSRKMRINDKTDSFTLTSIGQDQVTITYNNGTRETLHVKVY